MRTSNGPPSWAPYGRTAVQEEVFPSFAALLTEHDVSYQQEVDTYLSEGDDVVAFGRSILSKEGETIELPFAQHCRVVDGKLTYGHGYHDTARFFLFLGVDDPPQASNTGSVETVR